MDTEEAKTAKALEVRGPPFHNEENFEQVKDSYLKFLSRWCRFGLSAACEECGTLTPGRYCCESKTTHKLACKTCRERRTKYTLSALPGIPAALAALNALERRLLAMAQVDQVLIDKLPSGGPSAQWGRMYVAPMDEPRLCDLLAGAELGEDGEVYVTGVQGMMAAPARLEFLHAALQVLEAHHEAYKGKPAVKKALADMAHILEQMPAQQRQPQELVGGEGAEEEVEGLEITYLLPRDPAIPKADRADLQQLRRKAKSNFKNIDPVLFPHLFPSGVGGYQPEIHLKFSEYARRRLLGRDGRFENDPAYIMWLLEEQMKKRLSGNVNVRVKGQLQPQLGSRYDDFSRSIYTALRDLPGTQPYLFAKRGVAIGMYEQLGKPQFFLTVTCHARQPNILAAVITAKLIREEGRADREAVAPHPPRLPDGRRPQVERHDGQPALQLHACNPGPPVHAWFAAAPLLVGRRRFHRGGRR